MAELKDYTMDFGAGLPLALTCLRKLACAEVHCEHAVNRQ